MVEYGGRTVAKKGKLYADRKRVHYPRQNKRQRTGRFEAKAVNSKTFRLASVRVRTRSRSSY